MAFNNTRTILLPGPRGGGWIDASTGRAPWEPDKRAPMEHFRDGQFGAMPFRHPQPTILGAHATPGWQTRWTWSYIEAHDNPGLTRHFVRRAPDGHLLVPEALVGHTYRILVNAENGVLPATPDADFPEPTPSRSLMSIHCHTKYNEKGEAVDYYYLAYKLPTGAPELPPKVAATKHALQKRDRSWCLLPKTETQVPESWQPIKNKSNKSISKENGAQPTSAVLKDALKGSATVVKDACAKLVTNVLEVGISFFRNKPDGTIQEPKEGKQAGSQEKNVAQPPPAVVKDVSAGAAVNVPVFNYGGHGNSGNFGNSPNSPITKSPNYPITQSPHP